MFFSISRIIGLAGPSFLLFWYPNEVSIFAKPSRETFSRSHRGKRGWYMFVVEYVGVCDVCGRQWMGRDHRQQRSGCPGQWYLCGLVATKKEVVVPIYNSVLKIGRQRIKWILLQVVLQNMYAVLSRWKWFSNIDGSVVGANQVQDVTHSRRKVQSIRRDDYLTIEKGDKPQVKCVVGYAGKGDESMTGKCKITPFHLVSYIGLPLT